MKCVQCLYKGFESSFRAHSFRFFSIKSQFINFFFFHVSAVEFFVNIRGKNLRSRAKFNEKLCLTSHNSRNGREKASLNSTEILGYRFATFYLVIARHGFTVSLLLKVKSQVDSTYKVKRNVQLMNISSVLLGSVSCWPLVSLNVSRVSVGYARRASPRNEQPQEQPHEQLNEHPKVCWSYHGSINSIRSLTCITEHLCTNRSLLIQCGDVELHPGPGDAQGQGRRNDARVLQGGDGGDGAVEGFYDTQGITRVEGNAKEKSDLQVMTMNVRGLSDPKKVRHLVNKCYKLTKNAQNSFFMLQESFVVRLDILKYLWRGEFYLTPGTGNSQGCVTLITSPYKIVSASDMGNRAHVVVLTKNNLDRAEIILVNVYAPNGYDVGKQRFFEELLEKVSDTMATYNCNNVLVAGDLNLVFVEKELKNRLYSSAEKRIANSLKEMLGQLNISDGWSEVEESSFTWSSCRTGTAVFSTLDRVLYCKEHLKLMRKKTDWALSLSDHAAVIANLNYNVTKPNKRSQLSRLDPRLLQDVEGCQHLTTKFRELVDQAPEDWNPHVKLEYLKMCIRTASNEAVGKVKAKLRDTEKTLNEDINGVIDELALESTLAERKVLLMHKLDDLRQLKRSLVEKIGTKLEQKAARKWYNEGELSNKYFFNLLNRRANDEVTAILNEDGTETNNPEAIEEKVKVFYKELYESVPENVDDNDHLFRNITQVDPTEAAALMDDLTLDELSGTLKTCADSAPGPDGIPYSYLKHFWSDVGPVLLCAWKHSVQTGELPPSHKVSYLRLIPKPGKDTRIISNLRPITLSNTDHKLITKTYARKLTNIVSNCIGEEQTAYIPGRLINDNVRSMLMTIDLANIDVTVDGVVISLDAKKAFDSVDHRFIKRCLKAFGVESFIPIFNVLYKGLKSEIILNGHAIDGYKILKGVKQGDALSCIIFIMCMEPLIRNLKASREIPHITSAHLPIEIPKVYSFADDITTITRKDNRAIQAVFDEYELFSKSSGLMLNADKTEILCFNGHHAVRQQFDVNYAGAAHQLWSKDRIKVNGIILLQDPIRREETNVEQAIEGMERLLASWSTRRLTLLGRILIIKTFAISKLIYLMQTLKLCERSFNSFVKVVFKYLWNRNFNAARAPERLKRSIMYTPVSMGGFGMVDIRTLGDSLDLRSYGRLLTTRHPFMTQIRELINYENFFDVSVNVHVDKKLRRSIDLLNEGRRKILQWPSEVVERDLNLRQAVLNQSLNCLITPTGRLSLAYFRIHQRTQGAKIGQLTIGELQSVERFIRYPGLGRLCRSMLVLPLNHQVGPRTISSREIYPVRQMKILKISTLSSKFIRTEGLREEQFICLYKLGSALTPGEVLSWTGRLKKLTSTRHKNIILRVMHGDVFSNSRLLKFGLSQTSNCPNCPSPVESILHKISECPSAGAAWQELERVKGLLGLGNLTDLSIENLIGAKDKVSKIELTIQAELIHRLTSTNIKYCPKELVKRVIKYIGYSERLSPELKARFDDVLRN